MQYFSLIGPTKLFIESDNLPIVVLEEDDCVEAGGWSWTGIVLILMQYIFMQYISEFVWV
jgi:hypothetical protein